MKHRGRIKYVEREPIALDWDAIEAAVWWSEVCEAMPPLDPVAERVIDDFIAEHVPRREGRKLR